MRCPCLLGAALLAAAAPAFADGVNRFDLLPSSPGNSGGALGGLVNPAAWATADGELAFAWDDAGDLDTWSVAFGSPFGFAVERDPSQWRYQTGLAFGNRSTYQGFAWRWRSGTGDPSSESGFAFGTLHRPGRFVSIGYTGFLSAASDYRDGLIDLAIRPLGTSRVSVFGDYALTDSQRPEDGTWSAGLELRPVSGLHVGGRVREAMGSGDPEFLLNVGMTWGGLGYHQLNRLDDSGDRARTTHVVRTNPPHPGIPFDRWTASRRPTRLATINLERKSVSYQRDQWFDSGRVAWLDLVQDLRHVRNDPTAAGVAVNLSSARIRPSLLWEMRRELAGIRAQGKRVVVQLERARMSHYYLASVADHLSLDPYGFVDLTGVAARRTYWKGLLDKVGVGFQEHRYFTYKSANETYTRTDMSETDREQIGRFVDEIWREFATGIADGRGLSVDEVERLGDEEAVADSDLALEAGLVDAVGRWEDVEEWAKEEGWSLGGVGRAAPIHEERWGASPVLSIVYATGASAMDFGFQGRGTGDHLRKLSRRGNVRGVVLRADSPGGDPMAADRIARGMEVIREKGKSVVASQGDVAASAGYSICLRSDRIFTTPLTLTGSIGVISGWAWDEGVGSKTGFTADGVQRGRHADLWSGIRFPFLGVLPQRNLTDEELAIVKKRILAGYDDFIERVADARGLDDARVRELAEGRVWIGGDALERSLVDETGTLADAIDHARELAGIDPEEEVTLEEYPPRRRFRLPSFVPSLPRLSIGQEPAHDRDDESPDSFLLLKTLLARPGEPCHLVPLGLLPQEWLESR